MYHKPIGIADNSLAYCAAKFQLSKPDARFGDGICWTAAWVLIADNVAHWVGREFRWFGQLGDGIET